MAASLDIIEFSESDIEDVVLAALAETVDRPKNKENDLVGSEDGFCTGINRCICAITEGTDNRVPPKF